MEKKFFLILCSCFFFVVSYQKTTAQNQERKFCSHYKIRYNRSVDVFKFLIRDRAIFRYDSSYPAGRSVAGCFTSISSPPSSTSLCFTVDDTTSPSVPNEIVSRRGATLQRGFPWMISANGNDPVDYESSPYLHWVSSRNRPHLRGFQCPAIARERGWEKLCAARK